MQGLVDEDISNSVKSMVVRYTRLVSKPYFIRGDKADLIIDVRLNR